MDNSKQPLVKKDSRPPPPKEKSGWLKQLILGFEITTTVFSFLVIIFQFSLANSFSNSADQLKTLNSYIYIFNNIINYEIMYNITFNTTTQYDINVLQQCQNNNFPFIFKEIDAVNNTCLQTQGTTNVLRFEKNCTAEYTYNTTKNLYDLFSQVMCYTTFPKNYFVYYFRLITGKCELVDFTCGQTARMLICLQSNAYVTACPLIDFDLVSDRTVLDNQLYLIGNIPELSLNVAVRNFTTINNPYLSFRPSFETFNDVNFYDYYDNNIKVVTDYETAYENYYTQYNPLSNTLEVNENYTGRISDSRDTILTLNVYNFFQNFNVSETQNLFFLYQTISATKNVYFRISYFPIPNDDCIDYFFIQNSVSNTRGLFSVLSDISFDFLSSNLQQYVTWNFVQIIAFFVYAFLYRIISLSAKINKTLAMMDKKYEKLTLITLKMFYYICLMMKYIIIFNVDAMMNIKLAFINNLVQMNCFKYYSNFDPRVSLIHLNLNKLYNEGTFSDMKTKFSLIFYLTLLELANEGMSILFVGIDRMKKIL